MEESKGASHMSIWQILAIVLPPTFAYILDVLAKLQAVKVREERAAERVVAEVERTRARGMQDEQTAALQLLIIQMDQSKARLAELEALTREHAVTLNKLSEREF